MKSIIVGDLHMGRSTSLGKPSGPNNLNSRIQDQINLLDFIYDKCISDNIKHISLTGDVYHDFRPHPAIIAFLMRWLKKCENAGIKADIAMGNHDFVRSGQYIVSALDLVSELELPNANVHKTVDRVETDGFTFVFIPFRDKRLYEVKTKEEALQKFKDELAIACKEPSDKIKIAIGHMALDGSLSVGDEISDQSNELFVAPEVFEWFDFVWMGHIHKPQVIQNKNPYVAHIGSLDRSDFSKSELEYDKIAVILDSESENVFEEIILPTRNLLPITISVPPEKDSTDFSINELCILSKKLKFKDSIVRLNIELNGAELENVDRDKIKSYLFDHLEVHHLCDFSESRTISVININPEDVFDNTMEINQTINKWAQKQVFEDDAEREAFNVAAHEVRAEYEDKIAK